LSEQRQSRAVLGSTDLEKSAEEENDGSSDDFCFLFLWMVSFRQGLVVIGCLVVVWSGVLWQIAFQRGTQSCPVSAPSMRLSKDIGTCIGQLQEEDDFFIENPKHARVYCEAIVNDLTTVDDQDVVEMWVAMRNAVDTGVMEAFVSNRSAPIH
jgi:hypothetical protein